MTDTGPQDGFVEIPRIYQPERMEFWHNGILLVHAVPASSIDTEKWNLHMNRDVLRQLNIPPGATETIVRTTIFDVKRFVIGFGMLVKCWCEANPQ
jgi:hypothetical protein